MSDTRKGGPIGRAASQNIRARIQSAVGTTVVQPAHSDWYERLEFDVYCTPDWAHRLIWKWKHRDNDQLRERVQEAVDKLRADPDAERGQRHAWQLTDALNALFADRRWEREGRYLAEVRAERRRIERAVAEMNKPKGGLR